MTTKLFVGGFPYETTQDELTALFRTCGTVKSAKVLMDRETQRSRGIGFVEMATEAEAQAAIAKLNGSLMGSRKIFVNEARPPEKRPAGFGAPGLGTGRPAPGGPSMPSRDEPRRGSFASRKKKWADKKKWERKPGSGKPKDTEEGGARNKRGFHNESWDEEP